MIRNIHVFFVVVCVFFCYGAAVVERLHVSPFKRKTRVRFPELAPTYHSSFYCIYIHRIHYRMSDRDVKCWSRVSELYSGHVQEPGRPWWNTKYVCIRILSLLSFPCMHDKYVNIMTWIAYIVLKGRKTPIPPPPPPPPFTLTIGMFTVSGLAAGRTGRHYRLVRRTQFLNLRRSSSSQMVACARRYWDQR